MTPTGEEYYDRLVRSTSSATHAFKTASQVRLNRNSSHDCAAFTARRTAVIRPKIRTVADTVRQYVRIGPLKRIVTYQFLRSRRLARRRKAPAHGHSVRQRVITLSGDSSPRRLRSEEPPGASIAYESIRGTPGMSPMVAPMARAAGWGP